jgi:hypothetical protein
MLPKIGPSSRKQRLIFAGAFWPQDDDRYQVKQEFERLSESLEPVKDLFQLDFIDSAGDNIEKASPRRQLSFIIQGIPMPITIEDTY